MSDEFEPDSDELLDEQVEQERTTYFANYGEFVEEFVLTHYKRKGAKWDPEWYNYTDVCSVMRALWTAWEHLSSDEGGPLGMSVFFRDHFFPHMDRITSDSGPFANYDNPMKTGPMPDLETAPIDPKWFTSIAHE